MTDLQLEDFFKFDERNKRELAEHLHDHLGQSLAIIRMTLKKIQGDAVFCGLDKDINYALRLTEKCIQFSRDLVAELSPIILHQLGLIPALNHLAESYQNNHSISITLSSEEEYNLPYDMQTSIYRSVNELLMNIIKHANASTVVINFFRQGDNLAITVHDNGIGINKNQLFGFGLMSVQKRIQLLNGLFTITPTDQGSLATIQVPVRIETP